MMTDDTRQLVLLPIPRTISAYTGRFTRGWNLVAHVNDALFGHAAAAVKRSKPLSGPPLPIQFHVLPSANSPQRYTLRIETETVHIAAADSAGAFYAVQTLLQIARQCGGPLPCLEIDDYPDIAVRGFMLDISRDKVPTLATLYALVDQLASIKINQLQLYTEHTFAYSGHEAVWQHASPMTADEIRHLDRYCTERCIELVPNQNSFGHMERWLAHERYWHLAEAPEGAETPWGYRWKGPFSLCPTDPDSLVLLADLYAQLLPNFSSRFCNVGCDETFDVGQGRSAAVCAKRGATVVYVDFLNEVHRLVESHGRRMQFWGDIIVKHPEQIARLPKSAVALEWGYEADHPFDANARAFASAGLDFYLCPGTSSWNSFAGRTANAIDNLRSAARSAIDHHAAGYLITDWGDNGHLQYLPASFTALAAGAAFSWCLSTNESIDSTNAIAMHGFDEAGIEIARAWQDLGNVYQLERKPGLNSTRLFRALVPPPNDAHPEQHLTAEELDAITQAIDAVVAPVSVAQGLAADEFRNTAEMMRHAIAVARRKLSIPGEPDTLVHARQARLVIDHRRLWLARNRSGGLADSIRRLIA